MYQLSDLEAAQSFYSDFHKDLYGFRPRPSQELWESMEYLEAQIAQLHQAAPAIIAAEEQAQDERTAEFEKLVTETIQLGAGDRETALRWIMDASDCNGDWEFLCFEHGLPYGYFKKVA